MRLYSVLIFYIITLVSLQAADFAVSGVVTDSLGETEPYATLKIFSPSDPLKPVVANVAGLDGDFKLTLPSAGDYVLKVSAVGKKELIRDFSVSQAKPVADLGFIKLSESSTSLDELVVTAQRPLVSKEIDRIGYDVQADPDSKTSPVLDILRKVPLVSVQPDGTILVNGSSDYRIYRNGRPNASYSQNAKELFKSLPASSIKKIEVITDPGAREDAEGVGAILNIVVQENSMLKGVSGNVSLGMSTIEGYPEYGALFFTTQLGKFTISPYLNIFSANRRGRNENHSEYTYSDSGNKLISDDAQKSKFLGEFWGFDSSLEIDSLNLLTIEYSGMNFGYDMKSSGTSAMFDKDGNKIQSYSTHTEIPDYSSTNQSGAVNYQRSTNRKDETITLSYRMNMNSGKNTTESSYSDLFNFPMPYTASSIRTRTTMWEHTFQIDWSRPYAEIHKLDVGAKFIMRNSRSRTTQEFAGMGDSYTAFNHNTRVAAIYADYRVTIKKVGLRAGVRYEYSHLGGKYLSDSQPSFGTSLNDVVPSAAVNYNINDANSVKASYSMRINRPNIDNLNPAVVTTPTTQSSGNPHLNSANHHQTELNYTLTKRKINLNVTAGYQFADNTIASVMNTVGDIVYSSFANVGRTRAFTLNLYIQSTFGPKTSLSLNANTSWRRFRNPGDIPGLMLTRCGWDGFAFVQLNQNLPWKLRGTLSINYWPGFISGVYGSMRPDGRFGLDHSLSLQRSFLKDDRLSVTLMARNPFGPYNGSYSNKSTNTGRDGVMVSTHHYNSYAELRVSYRFGSLMAFTKKAKGIVNDDVEASSRPGSEGK